MNSLSKKFIIILIITLFAVITPIGISKATLQANPNTHVKKVDLLANWITNARNMEKQGEALGLSETLNSDLTASSENNGIDMHMMKSTEYGGIAILSASGYGNPQTLQQSAIKTTTGNKTGVYFTGTDWEYVSGGLEGSIPNGVNPIYYDKYTGDSNITKVGDALGTATTANPGCRGWHSAANFRWIGDPRVPYLIRGASALFSASAIGYYYGSNYLADVGINSCGRGVAVCGEGL